MALKVSPNGDKYEHEADAIGSKVVRQAPAAAGTGKGKPLPDAVRSRMESSLGADFSQVRVHEGPHVASIGAIAFTRGQEVHFAPGQYRPGTSAGQELLAHELAHVVQQQQGRVKMASGLAAVTKKHG